MSTTNSSVSDSISHSPAATLSSHEHGGHTVQFYAEDESLTDSLSRLVGTALGAGDAAIVIATKPHREALTKRLKARGLDSLTASSQGRYFLLDAAETLSTQRCVSIEYY